MLLSSGDFVRANGLQEGDFIVIYSDIKCNKYVWAFLVGQLSNQIIHYLLSFPIWLFYISYMILIMMYRWYEEWRYGKLGRNQRPKGQESHKGTSMQAPHLATMALHLRNSKVREGGREEKEAEIFRGTQLAQPPFSLFFMHENKMDKCTAKMV